MDSRVPHERVGFASGGYRRFAGYRRLGGSMLLIFLCQDQAHIGELMKDDSDFAR